MRKVVSVSEEHRSFCYGEERERERDSWINREPGRRERVREREREMQLKHTTGHTPPRRDTHSHTLSRIRSVRCFYTVLYEPPCTSAGTN